MSWLRWLFLGDLGQQLSISEQRQELKEVAWKHERDRNALEDKLQQLYQENQSLKLRLAALEKILLQKELIDESEVESAIVAIEREQQERIEASQQWRETIKFFTLKNELESRSSQDD